MEYGTKQLMSGVLPFMHSCIVLPLDSNIEMMNTTTNIRELTLRKAAGTAKYGTQDIPIYLLEPFNPTLHEPGQSFFAYWCRYAQDETYFCTLGNGASFMFTATMDGCSFGIGTQHNGACLVGHANEAYAAGKLREAGLADGHARYQQRLLQRNKLWKTLGDQMGLIDPTMYQTDEAGLWDLQSTTFGIHGLGQNWDFYTQRYRKVGNKFHLKDVIQQV